MGKVKHNMCRTRFYNIWCSMKSRCTKVTSDAYINYGGRGIKICDKWMYFDGFKEDMYQSYIEHVNKYGDMDTTIDRICNNKNYELYNCKWSTRKEQSNNRRPNSKQRWVRAVSPDGNVIISNNLRELCREYNLIRNGIKSCLVGRCKQHHGWKFNYLDGTQIN